MGADGRGMSKAERKRLEKHRLSMRDLYELFTAVEQDDIGKVRNMLEKGESDVNAENTDDLTMLDIACMLGHREVALLLLKHGAQENPRLTNQSTRSKHLCGLIEAARAKMADLRSSLRNPSNNVKDLEHQISSTESRIHLLNKMKNNSDRMSLPESPKEVVLEVASENSLFVKFSAPEQVNVITRYKVEWSEGPDFSNLKGTILIKDLRRLDVTLPGLETGTVYFVRVTAGNLAGYGPPCETVPSYAIPSSWRQCSGSHSTRCNLQSQKLIKELYSEVTAFQQSDQGKRLVNSQVAEAMPKRKKSSLKNLFLPNAKFVKNVRRGGVYLASLLYCEDKVVLTVDECLPMLEVEAEPTSSLLSVDFNWFLKVSCSWEDMRLSLLDSDVAHTSPMLYFRCKLLEAAAAMQSALGVQDLGRLHHKPIIDDQGATILVTVQHVSDAKTVQGLAVKWSPMGKLLKKQMGGVGSASSMDTLIANMVDYLNFYEATYIPIDRGLYLGYVKLHSTLTQISLLVPENLPSTLPFVHIRQNPHVSREEWEWLQEMCDADDVSSLNPSEGQAAFHSSLSSAVKVLLGILELEAGDIPSHRLYRLEVVEIHPEVSFLLLVPPQDSVCGAPGQPQPQDSKGCLSLPVHFFEMVHLCTYQPEFISLYCRLSSMLELYSMMAQQLFRQAMSNSETKNAKSQVDRLAEFSRRLEDVWKAVRWVSNVVTNARDKNLQCGLPLSRLMSISQPVSTPRPTRSRPPHRRAAAPNDSLENRRVAEDGNEDSSDVGYHSDQSIDKVGIAENFGGTPSQGIKEPSTVGTSAGSTHPGIIPSILVDNGTGAGPVVTNPNYDWLPDPPQSTSADPTQPSVILNAGLVRPAAPSSPQRSAVFYSSFLECKTPQRQICDYVNSDVERTTVRPENVPSRRAVKSPPPPPGMHKYSAPEINFYRREYANIPSSDSESSSQASVRMSPIVRTSVVVTKCKSDPIQRIREEGAPLALAEDDLSAIDHLYSTTGSDQRRASQPLPTASKSSPRTSVSPMVMSPETNSARECHSSGSSVTSSETFRPGSAGSSATSASHAPQEAGILRVYAAYDTGLPKGTSVRLHLTGQSTSREVVNLVIDRLNRTTEARGKASMVYEQSEFPEFCLVAVIGSRERCLRDDYRPLDLQNPWTKGRLYVRRRSDVCAAVEYGNSAQV